MTSAVNGGQRIGLRLLEPDDGNLIRRSRFHATMFGDNQKAQALVLSLSPRARLHFEAGG
jgi:hypothetical protein